jgi:hypothetical protein
LLASWVQRYSDADGKLWKKILDHKYDISSNIFCCSSRNSSPFWKGVTWAAQTAKLGYRWYIGDGRRVRFWEDVWFGTCSLATQYWNIYSIINEQGKTVRDVWDRVNLRFTFRRTISSDVMAQWLEVLQIAESLVFSDAEDAIIWQYSSSGKYAVQTLYAIVNERGVRQNFALVMWRIPIPPRLHVFLWLLANNKVLTRDNLAKRRQVDDKTCLFCAELESVSHLFFNCCVARMTCNVTIPQIFTRAIGPLAASAHEVGTTQVRVLIGCVFVEIVTESETCHICKAVLLTI